MENVRLSYRIILKCILEIFFDNNRSQWLVLVNNARVFGGVSTSGLPLILAVVMNCLKFLSSVWMWRPSTHLIGTGG